MTQPRAADGPPRGLVQVGGTAAGDLLRAASSPVLAVSPVDPRRMVLANRVEAPRFGCDVFTTADGGASWRRSRLVLPHESAFTPPNVGHSCYAPHVVFASDGRAHLLLTMLGGRGNEPFGHFLSTSVDGGATFGPPRKVLPEYSFQATLAAGADGALHLVWLDGDEFSRHATFGLGPPPNRIMYAVSHDGGRSFARPRPVSGEGRRRVGGPALALGPGEAVHVGYWDYRDDVFGYHAFPGVYRGHHVLVLASSRDGGRTFRERTVEPEVVPARRYLVYLPHLPALAVEPSTGALALAWEDGRDGAGDVLLRTSRDGGATWTPARKLFAGPADERTPALASARGRLAAAAYRIDGDGRADLAVRLSRDGGRTFTGEAALTPTPFDAGIAQRLPHDSATIDLGNRLAVALRGGDLLAAWADTRGGTADTGKVDVLLARAARELPPARALERARAAAPAEPPLLDRRLSGRCSRGPRVAERRSPLAVVRSFVSALDRRDFRRAHGYFHERWRTGAEPVGRAHTLSELRRAYADLACARLVEAESYDRSEDGKWSTFRVWIAVRRQDGRPRVGYGLVWAYSDSGAAPWSLMGYWLAETSRR